MSVASHASRSHTSANSAHTSAPSATSIVNQITAQLADPASPLRNANLTSYSIPGQNFSGSVVKTTVLKCSDGSFAPTLDKCPPGSGESNGVDKKLALGLGLGFGIPYVIVLAIVIYRSRTNAQQNRGFGNQGGGGGGGGGKNEPIQLTPLDRKGDQEELQSGPPGLEPIEDGDAEVIVETPMKHQNEQSGLASPSTTSP